MNNIQLKISPTGTVFLHLTGKDYKPKREIGNIKDRVFHTFRDPVKHLFRRDNSLGLNYELLKNGGSYFDKISIKFGFSELHTTRVFYLANGKFLNFQKNSLEKQLFLPVDLFGLDIATNWFQSQSLVVETGISEAENEQLQINLF